ncbi:asparaginase [Paraburkholderia sp. BCC1884]|uniref:asparaginase n=1 Tax=Paraburkholderia sp. BCC1884 TaxID=2562668 RepID=UPI001181E395|nr:asparaginase [Paraburkholderia sp. BCC1884]
MSSLRETGPIAATVYRGESIENTHRAHIAVVDADGRLLHWFGDPSRMTLARSAAKPAQALAILETGALERYGFDAADLALMCASHSSEARHIERARGMLAKAGVSEADMRCGGHPPLSDAVYIDWLKRDFKPGAVCSNCSGKHAGMLAAARALGAPVKNYEQPDHPLQTHVKHTVADVCDLPDDAVHWSTDGCNLPTPAFALDRLARLFAKLASAEDESSKGATLAPRTSALARIFRAMTTYPELIGGEDRFCTELMRSFNGALVGKVGADGSYAIGVRASDQTRSAGARGALGIAIKIEDGNVSALYASVVEVLTLLGIGTAEQRKKLDRYHAPKMLNTMGLATSHLKFSITLDRASAPA